jgi:hypothetical protein
VRAGWLVPPGAQSNASEPVIALVLPVAAGILVGDLDGLQVLGVLEPELGGDAKPQRRAPLWDEKGVATDTLDGNQQMALINESGL